RKRPVHWCIRDVTALAEAEVEYHERTSPSIYVGFRVVKGAPEGEPWFLAIWTTTPWTIPANLAVTVNPELEYVAYLVPGTGLVHTAPGHGEDDFRMGLQYGLPIWAPVDGFGKFTSDVGIEGLAGKKVFDANPEIVDKLRAASALLNRGGQAFEIRHSYP